MARNRFIKTHSNYVIKDLHQSTNVGNIYERDFMTISDLNSYAPGSLPAYGLNGFKMVVKSGVNLKKKHHYGSWLKNEACGTKSMYWTLLCMDETDMDNGEVTLKPNLNSVLDFACYGSTYKMIESSVKNIINKYPGELFLTDVSININGTKLFVVDNPFNIEMDRYLLEDENIGNVMRIFSESYSKYVVYDNTDLASYNITWSVKLLNQNPCKNEGDKLSMIDLGYVFGEDNPKLLLFYYIVNGKKVLLHDGSYTGGRIAPRLEVKKEFFNNLNYFEKVLLNKKTNYTAILETPKETNKGNIMYKKSYTWPKSNYGNWNIDISGQAYLNYFQSLLKIGEFYDNLFSDNLWRSLTHEAIINFDWTHTSIDEDGFVTEMDSPNSDRLKGFIHVAGRQFDELKQYIDGIANSNAITYNECQNKPDAFLIDELGNYGWDVKSPLSNLLSKFSSEALYPSHSDGYTIQEANNEFFRRLLLNSRAILSARGTKRSIEMIASLFGYYSLNFVEHSNHEVMRDGKLKTCKWANLTFDEQREILKYTYDITEYVYVAGSGSTLWQMLQPEDYEALGYEKEAAKVKAKQVANERINTIKQINEYKISYDFNNPDEYQGLPLKEVLVSTNDYPVYYWDYDTGEKYIHHYTPDYKPYLIPWFDRNLEYDADTYFESKGGWGLKQTTIGQFNEYNDVVIDTTHNLKIYDETIKYLRFVHTIDDLLGVYGEYPENNDVYYVYDISNGSQYDWGYLSISGETGQKSEPLQTMSHYFILKNKSYEDILGVRRDSEGNILLEDTATTFDENGTVISCNIVDEIGIPIKKYGWKNISEEEISRGISEDAKRVYYLESIVESNKGNNPHGGKGRYDDGNTYKSMFEDIFRGAKDNDSFIDTDDFNTPYDGQYGFNIDKQIDNVKCWYFTDTMNPDRSLEMVIGDGTEGYDTMGVQTPSVGDGNFVRFTDTRTIDKETNTEDEIFNSKQYQIMEPFNMEGNDANKDDEAAANSIINSKHLYIEFVPDISSPGSMYDFIENSIMHYVKQVIPSTTILKYYVPMRQMDVNCFHKTNIQSAIISE